jgi:hypothetical protein
MSRRAPLGAVVAIALAVGFVAWLVLRGDASEERTPDVHKPFGARRASAEDVVSLARALDYPVYWAGRLPGRTYELTFTRAGRVYVRYLNPGAEVGDRRARYLTVATYPQGNGFSAVRIAGRSQGARTYRLRDGGVAVESSNSPHSVFFSYPRARYQVEVFDPQPSRARRLVITGRIRPVR